MKVRIRDDESNDDVATWTISFAVRPTRRPGRDEDRKDGRQEEEDSGKERE